MTDRLSIGSLNADSTANAAPFASIAPYARAAAPGCRGVCPVNTPAATASCPPALNAGPASNSRLSGKPRASFRAAACAKVATGVGRIWSRSAAIGLLSRNAGSSPPNNPAVA